MPSPIRLDTPCEICGENKWWDNTTTKKSPKMPDFKCAGEGCKNDKGYPNGRWLPKDKAAAKPKEPQGGRITPDDTTPDERGEKVFSWEALVYTYAVLYGKLSVVAAKFGPLDPNAVQAGVATLLIQGEKAHIPLLHPRPKVEKVAPKKAELPEQMVEDWEEQNLPDWP